MKYKRQSLTVAVCAVLTALTLVFGWMPRGLFLLPILFTACCFGWGFSFFASLMFGVVSLLFCFLMPSDPVALFFLEYPFVPIVARMFLGPIAHAVYKGMTRLLKPNNLFNKIVPVSMAAIIGSFLNTLFVGIFLFTLPLTENLKALKSLTIIDLVIAGSIEIVLTAAILPPVVLTVKRALPRLFKEINGIKEKNDTKAAEDKQLQDSQQE